MNHSFPKCSLCGDFYIDGSEIDYLCFYCWRKYKVKRKMDKWLNANPAYKYNSADSIELQLQKEVVIISRQLLFEKELQPPVLNLTPYNLERAKLDCEVRALNRENIKDIEPGRNKESSATNVFQLNQSPDKK